MDRDFFRVVFLFFFLILVCFYYGGGSKYARQEGETKPRKLKKELNGTNGLKQDHCVVVNLRENLKQIDGKGTNQATDLATDLSKMAKTGNTLGSHRIWKITKPSSSTLSPLEINVPRKESTISHSREVKWKTSGAISSMENRIIQFHNTRETVKGDNSRKLLRNKREIEGISESKIAPTECPNSTFTIKYKDEYRVWKNFSMMYQRQTYYFYMYRVTDDGLQVCNSSDLLVQQRWWNFIATEKRIAFQQCNAFVDGSYPKIYTLFKNFTVFFHPTEQSFTRQDYGVIFGHFAICSAKLTLSCNDDLVKVKYDEQYNVFKNFSIVHNNTMYDYREYRFSHDSGLEICASIDSRVQAIWKSKNSWEKFKDVYKCNRHYYLLGYIVNNWFTVYSVYNSQYFTRNNYAITNGKPYICGKILRPTSTEYTQEDLLMCNDSINNIKYDDEYKVQTDFSIFYKNKVYDYTEYRVLNDSIKICNSTDKYVRNIWKKRNKWLKRRMHQKSCNKPIKESWLKPEYYTVNKQFTIYFITSSQYFTTNDYGLDGGKPYICNETIKPTSTEYTKEDLLMCNDSIINLKYDDEYKVWDNFSILYKNNVYNYTEYRVLNDSIKICNSTDKYVRDIWKKRTKWVKATMHEKSCNKAKYVGYYRGYYKLLKDFKVLILYTKQIITKYDYGVVEGKLIICEEKLIQVLILQPLTVADIAPLCALVLSIISLLSLLIVYCMLPELRALPGLNLMSLSFAFLLWLVYNAIELSQLRRVGTISKLPCDRIIIIGQFMTYIILLNAAVNIWVLRKTFCGNILLKSDLNKWRRFLKYSFFSWGVPVIITIIYIVVVKVDILRIYHTTQGCAFGNVPDWLAAVTEYSLPCSLLLYNIIMFIYTAYRLRQKLKASSSIAEKSNTVKTRKSFVLLLKLSTTVAITWLPVMFERYIFINVHYNIYMTLWTVAYLSGVYIGIAFVFTRRNYQLLKKKYFAAKRTPRNRIMPVNQ